MVSIGVVVVVMEVVAVGLVVKLVDRMTMKRVFGWLASAMFVKVLIAVLLVEGLHVGLAWRVSVHASSAVSTETSLRDQTCITTMNNALSGPGNGTTEITTIMTSECHLTAAKCKHRQSDRRSQPAGCGCYREKMLRHGGIRTGILMDTPSIF